LCASPSLKRFPLTLHPIGNRIEGAEAMLCCCIVSLSVALSAAVHAAGDAVCPDDASMLQVQATGQLKEQAAFGPHPDGDGDQGGTPSYCELDSDSDWTKEDSGTDSHDNDVWFENTNITEFDACTFCISQGQPWSSYLSFKKDSYSESVFGGNKKTGTTITIKAGRHKEKNTAECFKKWEGEATLSEDNMLCSGCLSTERDPDKLNFAIKGTLHLATLKPARSNIECPNFRIGQGHGRTSGEGQDGKRNLWYLGCSAGEWSGASGAWGKLVCPCRDSTGTVQVRFDGFFSSGSVNRFRVDLP